MKNELIKFAITMFALVLFLLGQQWLELVCKP